METPQTGHLWTFKFLVSLQIPQGAFPTQRHLHPQAHPLFPPEDQLPRVLPLYVVAYLLELVWEPGLGLGTCPEETPSVCWLGGFDLMAPCSTLWSGAGEASSKRRS